MSDPNKDPARQQNVGGEIPVRIEKPDPVLKRIAIATGIVLLSIFWLVVGFALLAVSIAVAIVGGLAFLLWWGLAVLVTVFFHLSRRRYPIWFRFPIGPRRAKLVFNDAANASVAPTASAFARGTILVLGPLVFLAWLGVGWKAWRARKAQVGMLDLPLRGSALFRVTLRAALDVAGRWGFLLDGYGAKTDNYDDWLDSTFAEISAFVAWWPLVELPVESYSVFTPIPVPITVGGEQPHDLQPSPDPRGFPGLASAVIRRKRITDLRGLFHSSSEIGDMGDPNLDDCPDCGVVRIVRTTNFSGERWIVQIASTRSWLPQAGQAPNDLTADVFALSGRETSLLRGALAAMAEANIPADAPVLMTGFSLGGLIAAQLATGKYLVPGFAHAHRYSHLIVAGSPIARFGIAEGVRVLSLEHKLDPIHRLDGRPRATGTTSSVPWVTAGAGPPLPDDYSLGQTHHAPSYAETAQTFATTLDDPVAREYWAGQAGSGGAQEYFVGTQVITDFAVRRDGVFAPRPSVPAYAQKAGEGRLRGRLRAFLRRLDGVIAADVYVSRNGFPTTKSWSIDLLVTDIDQAMTPNRRRFSYEGLLAIAEVGGAVELNMRVMSRNQRTGHVAASLSRASGGAVREDIDIDGQVSLASLEPLTSDARVLVGSAADSRTTFLYPRNPFLPSSAGADSATGPDVL